jgi:hypothetical protein
MTGHRAVAWDGLSLAVPAGWEPARLGLGYLFLEDSLGPRLTLRWQRQKGPLEPEAVLKRLARSGIVGRSDATEAMAGDDSRDAAAAWLGALPEAWRALPCSDASGRGGHAVLFVIPGEHLDELAVLAAPHPRPGEDAAIWARAAASLAPAPPGEFSLYDVRGRAPSGFRLTSFAVQLGHFHFRYASRTGTLEYHRFAPAEAILRGKTLEGWAGDVFARELGKPRRFEMECFGGLPSAGFQDFRSGGLAKAVRVLAAGVFASARFVRVLVWRPDQARIFAVVARHAGGLSRESFEEVCRRYVAQTP